MRGAPARAHCRSTPARRTKLCPASLITLRQTPSEVLRTHHSARVRAAWGSDKTGLAAHTTTRVAPDGSALVLIPDEDHLESTIHAWRGNGRTGPAAILSGGPSRHDPHTSIRQIGTAQELATLIHGNQGPLTVFTTYQHKLTLQSAHREHDLPAWDMLVAHLDHADKAPWADLHKPGLWPAHHRLYLTAMRQRPTGASIFTRHTRRGQPASVDETATYGPLAWDRTFSSAVDEVQLRDYSIFVSDTFDSTMPFRFASDVDASRRTQLLVNTFDALRLNRISRCLFFTDSDDTASHHAQQAIPAAIASAVWSDDHTTIRRVHCHTVLEHDTPDKRAAALAAFNDTPTHQDGTCALLFCTPKALAATSSFTPPAVDAAVIGSPDYGTTVLTRAVRQSLRPVLDSTHPVVLIVPIVFPEGDKPNRDLATSLAYEPLAHLMRVLVSHDDRIVDEETLIKRLGC
ncbi:hypothetical protein [Streptomyces sp. NPDC005096]|uniref:hypothetical protein n=1 Tax=Streptomyces sp. NPDC005096 TaxID=3154559 RepID=UPI0033A64EA7